jgi:hypothetical protein
MKIENPSKVDRIYSDPLAFKARTLEEISRAKRYATFVSMVSVDLSHADIQDEIENYHSYDDFMVALRKLVKVSIRDTDLMSDSDHHKILILLMDTAKEGASSLSDRIRKLIRYFLCSNIKSPNNWRVPITEYYFPSAEDENLSIQAFLDQLGKN